MALHREGLSQREISRQLHLSRNTVQRYICSPGFPERSQGTGLRNTRSSKLDPYLPFLRDQWDAGNTTVHASFVSSKNVATLAVNRCFA
jgi:transposase